MHGFFLLFGGFLKVVFGIASEAVSALIRHRKSKALYKAYLL